MKVILNSANRVSSTPENCVWILSEEIHSATQFRVRQCIIPNVSPSFRFDGVEDTLVLGGVSVKIPANKRYTTMPSFLADLNSAVALASIPNVTSLVFTFDADEGCLYYTHTSSANWTVAANARYGDLQSSIVTAGTAVTLPFSSIFSLPPYKAILLSSNSLMTDDVRSSTDLGSAIAMIPIRGAFGDVVTYQNENGEYMRLNAGSTLSRIHMILRDESGREISLQGQDWLIELEII